MRRSLALATAAVATLAPAGVALAHLTLGGTQSAAATFSAARQRADIRTCTGPDGTYEIVKGQYEGQAVSTQSALNGPIVLKVSTVYNKTEQIGWMTGLLQIRATDHGVQARLVGTLTQGSGDTRIVDGFVDGRAGGHGANVFGNVTASFTGTGGFTGGKIGEGGANQVTFRPRVRNPNPSSEGRLTADTRGQRRVHTTRSESDRTLQATSGRRSRALRIHRPAGRSPLPSGQRMTRSGDDARSSRLTRLGHDAFRL